MLLFNALSSIPDINNNLFPNLSTLIAHIIATLIILYFLIRWAWKPFKKSQKDREKYISDVIKKAENSKIIAKANEEKIYEHLNDSKLESLKILDNAKMEAELYKVEKINEIEKEISFLKQQAKEEIENEKASIRENAKKEILDLSFIIAEKIISKNLSAKENQDIIDEILDGKENKVI